MNRNTLDEAKQRLRIPELWRLLNLPGVPAKSCRCPWRDDHNPSFSVFADGMRWRDFATDEGGDAIDFLAKARGLSLGEAIHEFKRLAGL
jgi:DNA primase